MGKTIRKSMRQEYVSPQVNSFCPSEDCGNLLSDSAVTDIQDAEWGGDLGGDVSGGNGSKAVFGDLLWDEEFANLAGFIEKAEETMQN